MLPADPEVVSDFVHQEEGNISHRNHNHIVAALLKFLRRDSADVFAFVHCGITRQKLRKNTGLAQGGLGCLQHFQKWKFNKTVVTAGTQSDTATAYSNADHQPTAIHEANSWK